MVSIALIINAKTNACSAELSAFILSSAPMNLAIDAVTPFPNPNERPITKKNIGILNATAAIASPPNRPIKIISIIVYSVWIPIPIIIGIAKFHIALAGLLRNDFRGVFLCSA